MIASNTQNQQYDIRQINQIERNRMCRNCGGIFPHQNQCLAFGLSCNNCGKPHHFAKVCMSSTRSTNNSFYTRKPSEYKEGYTHQQPTKHRHHHRQSHTDSRRLHHNNNHQQSPKPYRYHNTQTDQSYSGRYRQQSSFPNQQTQQPVNQVETSVQTFNLSSQPQTKNSTITNQIDDYSDVYTVNTISRNQTRPLTTLKILDTSVTFLIDSGAGINIIDSRTFNSLRTKPKIEPTKTIAYGYNSKEPLVILGEFTSNIATKDKSISATFCILEGNSGCLLSYKTGRELDLIHIVNEVDITFKMQFPDLFSGKIEKLKNF